MSENKITVDELRQTIDANYLPEVTTVWHGLKIVIKKHLDFTASLNYVEKVVSSCFAEGTGEYIPEVKDFMIRCGILEDYANFELPGDLYERFDLVSDSMDLIRFILENIEHEYFDALIESIDQKIEYRANSNAEELTRQVGEVVSGFEDLEKDLSGLFGGIDADTILQIAGAISNGAFDEDKLVSAVIASNTKQERENNGKI